MEQEYKTRTTTYNEVDNPKGIVIFSHAFVENAEYYKSIDRHFLDHGYNIFRYTLQGHDKRHIESVSMESYVEELRMIVASFESMSSLPIFLVGFSLGALITTMYNLSFPNTIRGSVIIGTPLVANTSFYNLDESKYSIETFLDLLNTKGDDGVKWLLNHKYIETVSKSYLESIFYTAPKKLLENLDRYTVPTLVLCGENDPMISYQYSIDFATKTNNPYKIYPNMYHDLLRVKGKQQVYKDIFNFLDSLV